MATHSSILAWEIPWTEEPGRLQSMGWQRVGHNLATKPPTPPPPHTHTHTHTHTYITESPYVHLKLTRYCKSTRLQFKKQKKWRQRQRVWLNSVQRCLETAIFTFNQPWQAGLGTKRASLPRFHKGPDPNKGPAPSSASWVAQPTSRINQGSSLALWFQNKTWRRTAFRGKSSSNKTPGSTRGTASVKHWFAQPVTKNSLLMSIPIIIIAPCVLRQRYWPFKALHLGLIWPCATF